MVQWVIVIPCCANGKLRTQLIERAITVLLKSQDKIIFHNERGNKEHFWRSMQSSFYLAFSWHQSLCSGHQGWNLSQPVLQGGFAGEGMVRKWRGAAALLSSPWLWAWCGDIWGCAPGKGKPVSPWGAVWRVPNWAGCVPGGWEIPGKPAVHQYFVPYWKLWFLVSVFLQNTSLGFSYWGFSVQSFPVLFLCVHLGFLPRDLSMCKVLETGVQGATVPVCAGFIALVWKPALQNLQG